ncbi:MAG TPA: AAA family ATPase, partial [Thermoanaerobaculia bacterium]|nr:AAA family ATPase [Thermoanaerobaculia bacterium]
AAEDRAIAEAHRTGARLLIHDTDLVSTYVYARHYYSAAPPWLEAILPSRLAHHYVLLSPDTPFTVDAVRDATVDRDAIHAAMASTLDTLGARYTRVGGGWEGRLQWALATIADSV